MDCTFDILHGPLDLWTLSKVLAPWVHIGPVVGSKSLECSAVYRIVQRIHERGETLLTATVLSLVQFWQNILPHLEWMASLFRSHVLRQILANPSAICAPRLSAAGTHDLPRAHSFPRLFFSFCLEILLGFGPPLRCLELRSAKVLFSGRIQSLGDGGVFYEEDDRCRFLGIWELWPMMIPYVRRFALFHQLRGKKQKHFEVVVNIVLPHTKQQECGLLSKFRRLRTLGLIW
ncbi:hypothetical protein MPTK1_8g17850 [Marchantia polymorpha subsp. ruderalis]|uniref:Uncharacterized protein n=1 Tax=Marchantia polymorpha TaxID=3197 RepID=A0A2R6X8G6_MARPO|nr:hypothetical protein MARPO_0030s0119 [Marchantia polymorpha]BBN20276.1 hypothetical protein Mp_8g17850 [Marchantia polymorpha subsp. ruderalis]|eukprot:PTQ42395.1 hypothetical protein MARPO_0030s0119 [Marchantia polymorpha]